MNKSNSNPQINNDELISMDDLLKDDLDTAVELKNENAGDTNVDVKVEEPKEAENKEKSKNLGVKYGAAAAVGVGVAAAGAYAIDGMNAPAPAAAAEGVVAENVADESMNSAATAEEIANIITGGSEEEVVAEEPAVVEEEIVVEEPAVVEGEVVIDEPAVVEGEVVVDEPAVIEEVSMDDLVVEEPIDEVAAEHEAVELEEEIDGEESELDYIVDGAIEGEESELDEMVSESVDLPEEPSIEIPVEPAPESATLHFDINDVNLSNAVNDNMDFNQAFAAARADIGANGVFEWRGGVYGTFYQNEWENISEEYKQEFNNHDWRGEFDLVDNAPNVLPDDPINLAGDDSINMIDDDLHAHLPNYIPEDGKPNVISDPASIGHDSIDLPGVGHLADNGGHAIDGFALNVVPESVVPELVADSAEDFSGAYVLTEDPSVNMIAMADDIIDVLPVDIAENVDIDVQVMNVVPADDMSAFEPMDDSIVDDMAINSIDDVLI